MNSPENKLLLNSINWDDEKTQFHLMKKLGLTFDSEKMDIFKKKLMEKSLEKLLAKPQWQDHFMSMLVEHLEQSIKINEPAILSRYIDWKECPVPYEDVEKFNEITQFFKPDEFYDILKKHIKPEEEKVIYNSKKHTFCGGAFSELDVWWHPNHSKPICASEMPTKHLFSSVEYIYNRSMPRKYRTKDIQNDTVDTRLEVKHTLKCMFYQIGLRDDLTEEQFEKLTLMAKNVRLYL